MIRDDHEEDQQPECETEAVDEEGQSDWGAEPEAAQQWERAPGGLAGDPTKGDDPFS